MADGRRRELRMHAMTQAALVWSVDEVDAESFVQTGEIGKAKSQPMSPGLRTNVDKYLDSIVANGGRLII